MNKFIASALVAAAPSFAGDNISGEVGYVPQVNSARSSLGRDAVRAEAVYAVRHGQQWGGEV